MAKIQTALYGIALLLVVAAAVVVESEPLWAIGLTAGAGILTCIAERR